MTATFVLSADVEGLWGLFFVRSYVEDTSVAEGGLVGLSALSRGMAERDLKGTFAFVGHLFHDRCGPWDCGDRPHPDFPRPRYDWYDRDWLGDDPGTDEDRDPLWYGRRQAQATAADGHEIGAHGYVHAILDEGQVGPEIARAELENARRAAEDAGLGPLRSFIFPQNVVGHVDELTRAGYLCYRDTDGGRPVRAGPPGGLGRALNLARHALGTTPFVGVPRVRDDGLVVIPSSFPLIGREGLRKGVTRAARVARIERGLRAAAAAGAVLHPWTHPHAFGTEAARDDLLAILDRVALWRDRGDARVLTMGELAAEARGERP